MAYDSPEENMDAPPVGLGLSEPEEGAMGEEDAPTSRAAEMIDVAIASGKSGAEIIADLEGGGITLSEGEAPMDEEMPEEGPMDLMPEGEELPGDEGPMDMGMGMGMGGEPKGSNDGGMRDMRLAAVRFALDKDKKGREEEDGEEYA